MMIFTIAGRELRSLFLSPLAWTILGVVQFIYAYLFLSQVDTFLALQSRLATLDGAPGVVDIVVAPLFANAAVLLLLITPLITMRVLSEERRNHTLSLLFSAPISMTEIIVGKYLGVLSFILILIGMLALMPLSLMVGTDLDLGKFAAGLLGLTLVVSAFTAIGIFMSSLTEQPTIAAISTFGLLLLLWILDWAGSTGMPSSGLLGYLSVLHHYEPLLKGLFSSVDVIYYLLIIILFLVFSIRRLDADRLQH
ncbi:MAG: ABC transporter permease subunit [Gammaproteobacteria bacterium]